LSVSKTAALCGVNRNTVGIWIRTEKLRAHRVGRKYSIPIDELIFFLKSTGQKIPEEIATEGLSGPYFRAVQSCWQYFKDKDHGKNCQDCIVYKNNLDVCFTGKETSSFECKNDCDQCQFYLDTYYSRIQFIHQIDLPSAVYKGLFFWGGNKKWTNLCGVNERDMVGMLIENIYHQDSLRAVISNNNKRELRDPSVPMSETVFIRGAITTKQKVIFGHYPLTEPYGTWLLIAESDQ